MVKVTPYLCTNERRASRRMCITLCTAQVHMIYGYILRYVELYVKRKKKIFTTYPPGARGLYVINNSLLTRTVNSTRDSYSTYLMNVHVVSHKHLSALHTVLFTVVILVLSLLRRDDKKNGCTTVQTEG